MADTYQVERTQKIDAPPEEVFAHIVDLKKWDAWSPWEAMDPNMKKTYTGETGAVGAKYHWVGNRKVGEGEMTVTEVDGPSKLGLDLKFIKPFKSESKTELVVEPAGDGSQVTWRMSGHHTWMSKIMGFFKSMDKMVGPDFEKGLSALKRVAES